MHIEKINDNQIKCILSQRDLSLRGLDLSELAYGTEKARSLFREMIDQAHDAFGFEAEDMPLMVEAIPLSRDSIILIITRIDDLEELDTRFSRFSPMERDFYDDLMEDREETLEGADDILDLYRSMLRKEGMDTEDMRRNFCEACSEKAEISAADIDKALSGENRNADGEDEPVILAGEDKDEPVILAGEDKEGSVNLAGEEKDGTKAWDETSRKQKQDIGFTEEIGKNAYGTSVSDNKPVNLMRIYSFSNLDDLIKVSEILHPVYNGVNSLYKDTSSSMYYLTVYQSHHTPSDFNRTCNILSEYGRREKGTTAREAYYAEHYNCIVSQTALQRLYLF